MKKMVPGRPKRRFPRRATPELVSAIEKLRWSQPTFDVRLSKDGTKTVFLFRLPFPGGIRKADAALYHSVFGKEDGEWLKAVTLSYLKTMSGDKTAHYHISNFLERVVRRALRLVLASDWPKDKAHRDIRRRYVKELKRAGRKKPGPQPNPHLAIQLERRYRDVESILRKILASFRNESRAITNKVVKDAIEEHLPFHVVRRAIAVVLDCEPIKVEPVALRGKRMGIKQVAKAVVECELKDEGQSLGHCKLASYLREGRQLLKGLDCIDSSRWPALLTPHS